MTSFKSTLFFLQSIMSYDEGASTRNTIEGNLVRDILYASRENVNFVHEVYRQAFLLSFSHSPAIKKVITVYKDWIQVNINDVTYKATELFLVHILTLRSFDWLASAVMFNSILLLIVAKESIY